MPYYIARYSLHTLILLHCDVWEKFQAFIKCRLHTYEGEVSQLSLMCVTDLYNDLLANSFSLITRPITPVGLLHLLGSAGGNLPPQTLNLPPPKQFMKASFFSSSSVCTSFLAAINYRYVSTLLKMGCYIKGAISTIKLKLSIAPLVGCNITPHFLWCTVQSTYLQSG